MQPATVTAKTPRRPLWRSLLFQVLVAIVLGVAIGALFPDFGKSLKPLGDGFIKLIKMVIAPLVFCVVVTGIAKVGDLKSVGRIGLKALVYFQLATGFAILWGLLIANLFQPGAGLNVDPSTLDASAVAQRTGGAQIPSAVDFLLHIIPNSAVAAFAENEILQVLLFALLFAFALMQFGEHGPPVVLEFIEHLTHVIFRIVGYIMKLAPLGALGAMGFTIGSYGLGSLLFFGKLILACYGAAVLFILVLAVIARVFAGVNLWQFLRYTREEFLLALGTGSSESVLPRIIAKLQNAGAQPAVVGLVIPTGYSFNLDGAAIYLSLASVFLAQAVGHPLSLVEQLAMVGVLLLTSKGMAGVPGSAFLALSATAAAVGAYPAAAVALMLGADRFMDSMRVFTNLLGNCVATLVVARWENLLDFRQLQVVLSGKLVDEEAVGEDVPPVEDKELEGIAHKSEVEAVLAQAGPASSEVVPAAG